MTRRDLLFLAGGLILGVAGSVAVTESLLFDLPVVAPVPPRAAARVPDRVEIADAGVGVPIPEVHLKWERVDRVIPADDPARVDEDLRYGWTNPGWVMRPPGAFQDLPADIRADLETRGCLIPQSTHTTAPHNLLWGEFERRGQRDLIVQCLRGRSGRAYVFWGGDLTRLEILPFGGMGTALTIATAENIDSHAYLDAQVTPDMPASIDHDPIEESCCECCSTYYYRHQGRWFSAPGAD